MANVNPYQAPTAAVAGAGDQTQPVKIFSVSGRIGRARYVAWGFAFYMLFGIIMGVAGALGKAAGVILIVAWLALVVIAFMLTVQRCHDFNASGWLALLMIVPLVNLIFLFIPGSDGPNRFGPPTPPNTVGVLIGAWAIPVVAIIGVLAAIALPAYQDYQKRAGQVQKR